MKTSTLWPVLLTISPWMIGCDPTVTTGQSSLDDLPELELVEELRIGSVVDPDFGFTTLGGVRVVEGDTLYVSEWSSVEIRVYSPSGELVRRIGRRGEGPGEVQSVTNWGMHGDTVWVIDDVRATFFRRDGSLISTIPLRRVVLTYPSYSAILRPVRVGSDGRIVGESMPVIPRGTDLAGQSVTLPQVVYGSDGLIEDTIGYRTTTIEQENRVSLGRVVIDEQEYPTSADLVRVSNTDTIRIHRPPADNPDRGILTYIRVDSTGDTLVHRDFEYTPIAVPSSYRDSIIQARLETLSPYADPAAIRAAIDDMYTFADYWPAVVSASLSRTGWMWLRRSAEKEGRWQWILLAPDGTIQGEVATSPSISFRWSDTDVVYVEERDSLNVPWLVKYRLRQAAVGR